jgi:thiol-disulfide isomerase/thioredoxin
MRAPFSLTALVLLFQTTLSLAAEPFMALDRKSAKALVDPAAHARPTIVALWSIDCSHCKKNLQLFARLAKVDRRFTLITVAAERASPLLAGPLDKLAVPGKRYAYGEDAPEAIAFALDPKWRGELPRTIFFDGRGNSTAISGVVDESGTFRRLGLAPLH